MRLGTRTQEFALSPCHGGTIIHAPRPSKPMDTILHNTLTRKREPLKSQDSSGTIGFYCCGPTVYGPAHIGNFRTFLLQDTLRRVLEMEGKELNHVRNLTDVDDKTIRQSIAEGESLTNFTKYWTEKFHQDCERLNMLQPHHEPAATTHIQEQIDLIQTLLDKDHAYTTNDGSVYFRISSYPEYGRLSNLDNRETQTQETTSSGDRNDADEYDRETVADFALWKSYKEEDGDNSWDSPWGKGRPGWHIECSAMSMKYLGETFDIHGGGVDLCFPHHENEIAQSQCATCKPFVAHWFHTAHLMVEGGKMSKSLGNLYTLEDIIAKGHTAQELRYLLLSGSYRQPLNFTMAGLNAAHSALEKLQKQVLPVLEVAGISPEEFLELPTTAPEGDMQFFQKARANLNHDLNTPAALGNLFSALKTLHSNPPKEKAEALTALTELHTVLTALGIRLEIQFPEEQPKVEAPAEIEELAQKRWQAKQDKDWGTADELRNELHHKGWQILDRKDGYDLAPIEN